MIKSSGQSAGVDRLDQNNHESPLEAQSRKEASFADIEAQLPKRFTKSDMSFIDKSTSKKFRLHQPKSVPNLINNRLAWNSQSLWQESQPERP